MVWKGGELKWDELSCNTLCPEPVLLKGYVSPVTPYSCIKSDELSKYIHIQANICVANLVYCEFLPQHNCSQTCITSWCTIQHNIYPKKHTFLTADGCTNILPFILRCLCFVGEDNIGWWNAIQQFVAIIIAQIITQLSMNILLLLPRDLRILLVAVAGSNGMCWGCCIGYLISDVELVLVLLVGVCGVADPTAAADEEDGVADGPASIIFLRRRCQLSYCGSIAICYRLI